MWDKIANWFANWLGKTNCFAFCCLLVIISTAALIVGCTTLANAHFVLSSHFVTVATVCGGIAYFCTFVSTTVLQLVSLPALQYQSIKSEVQRQEDHQALTVLLTDIHSILQKLTEIKLITQDEKSELDRIEKQLNTLSGA